MKFIHCHGIACIENDLKRMLGDLTDNTPSIGYSDDYALTLLAAEHTVDEHRLYQAMLGDVAGSDTRCRAFTLHKLRLISGLPSFLLVRQALTGLVNKFSIQEHTATVENKTEANKCGKNNIKASRTTASTRCFQVFTPQEIFARRYMAQRQAHATDGKQSVGNQSSAFAETERRALLSHAIARHNISCREADVALFCLEGLTNAEIARRLHISEPTVKFHLRNIYTKCGVKRRTALIAHFLTAPVETQPGYHEEIN